MKKTSKHSASIEDLNRAFKSYERLGLGKDINAMTSEEFDEYALKSRRAGEHYEKILAELRDMGSVVKFDSCLGELFAGKDEYRIVMTVVSQGWISVQAESEAHALEHARKLAETDEIDLVETEVRFDVVSEKV